MTAVHPIVQAHADLAAFAAEVRRMADGGDRAGLAATAPGIAALLARHDTTHSVFRPDPEELAAIDAAYDTVFPVADPADAACVLDGPFSTEARRVALAALVGVDNRWYPPRDPLVDRAVADGDVRLLRLVVASPVGVVRREAVVRALDALAAGGSLDPATAEQALIREPLLAEAVPERALPAVRAAFDEVTWRLVEGGADWDELPQGLRPRGLRFVLRAALGRDHWRVGEHLGQAELTDAERDALVAHLAGAPDEERRRAFRLRRPAGDAAALLPVLGLEAGAELLALIDRGGRDRAEILAVTGRAGADVTRVVLELAPSELVAAALGWNRAEVERRVRHSALDAIEAFGMLPLAGGETVRDRYLALRKVADRGPRLSPNRRHSHAAAVTRALANLAEVAGHPDVEHLERACAAP